MLRRNFTGLVVGLALAGVVVLIARKGKTTCFEAIGMLDSQTKAAMPKQGAGAGSSLEFDQTGVSVIGLWNNDAAGSTPVITAYYWDPIDGRYEYLA